MESLTLGNFLQFWDIKQNFINRLCNAIFGQNIFFTCLSVGDAVFSKA